MDFHPEGFPKRDDFNFVEPQIPPRPWILPKGYLGWHENLQAGDPPSTLLSLPQMDDLYEASNPSKAMDSPQGIPRMAREPASR